MKLFHKIKWVLIFAILLPLIIYRNLISYGIAQLRGQVNIVWNAKPVDEVIQDKNLPDSIKQKLFLIQEIRKYAIDSLGLKESKNYTTYFDQKGKPVLWVITACEPFEMKAYQWHFPFLGDVSYKGFFEKERGIPELNKIKNKGYDTEYSPAGGWSTLGWFKDPILSGMLRRNEGQIAELIIHELTHATVYISNDVDYNENLATFIGEQGALRFLKSHFGNASKELINYKNLQQDEKIFGNYMVQSCHQLDSAYKTIPSNWSLKKKVHFKYFYIKDLILGIRQLKLNNPDRYTFHFPGDHLPNNAWFMSYSRYRNQQSDFQAQLDSLGGDLKAFTDQIVVRNGNN